MNLEHRPQNDFLWYYRTAPVWRGMPPTARFDGATHDLGHGHTFSKVLDDSGQWIGIIEYHHSLRHRHPDCAATVLFQPYGEWRKRKGVQNLTLSPSLRCECGSHGFVRKGKWVEVKPWQMVRRRRFVPQFVPTWRRVLGMFGRGDSWR